MTYVDQVRIVPITTEHIDQLVAMEKRCFSDPWTRGMFRSELEVAGGTYARGALAGDQLVAYSFAIIVHEEAHLGNLAVDPAYRRKGIAQALLMDLLNMGRTKGVRRVTLEVRESNEIARNFYARNGFVDIAMRKDYYRNPVEDAIVMMLILPGGTSA